MRFMFFAKFVPLAVVLAVVFTACGSASEDNVEAPPSTVEVALPTVQPTTVEPVVEPTEVPTGVPTVEVGVEPSVEAVPVSPEVVLPAPSPVVVCEVLVVHGEPHEGVPVDTDGDGLDDDCFYLGGGAGHTHETPTAEPAETGAQINPPAQPAEPARPVATAAPAAPAQSGAGWHLGEDGSLVVTRVLTQAEVGSNWPVPGSGQQEMDWVARCAPPVRDAMVRDYGLFAQWGPAEGFPFGRSLDAAVRNCTYNLADGWFAVEDGRDKTCVYDSLFRRYTSTGGFYTNNDSTIWDCPTSPDGRDPDPLRPFQVRCEEMENRLIAEGYEVTSTSQGRCYFGWGRFDPSVLVRDPANPCQGQMAAAEDLLAVWLEMTGTWETSSIQFIRGC